VRAVKLSQFLAAELEKQIPVTKPGQTLEMRCRMCGETYIAASETEEHAVSLDGIPCGGVGEVMGIWQGRDGQR